MTLKRFHNLLSPRCDRERAVCRYGDPDYHDCLRRPMKIFYSHSTFSHLVPLPVKIFTTRVTTYSRRIKYKYELKLISASGSQLTEDEFKVKQVNNNTFEIYLLKQCHVAQNIQLDLKIEFYNEATFSSCLLNKVFVCIMWNGLSCVAVGLRNFQRVDAWIYWFICW